MGALLMSAQVRLLEEVEADGPRLAAELRLNALESMAQLLSLGPLLQDTQANPPPAGCRRARDRRPQLLQEGWLDWLCAARQRNVELLSAVVTFGSGVRARSVARLLAAVAAAGDADYCSGSLHQIIPRIVDRFHVALAAGDAAAASCFFEVPSLRCAAGRSCDGRRRGCFSPSPAGLGDATGPARPAAGRAARCAGRRCVASLPAQCGWRVRDVCRRRVRLPACSARPCEAPHAAGRNFG
jgi:hypothetical protein